MFLSIGRSGRLTVVKALFKWNNLVRYCSERPIDTLFKPLQLYMGQFDNKIYFGLMLKSNVIQNTKKRISFKKRHLYNIVKKVNF